MCDFNQLNEDEKAIYHKQLQACANDFGGVNFFLQLLEAIRDAKAHPLTSTSMSFDIELGTVKWNKVIFNDKLQVLLKARKNGSKQDNLLLEKDDKNYKKVLNVVRTLKPIVFHVTPANPKDGSGFFFSPFDMINDSTTKLNPLFDATFFCSVDTVKKLLDYTPKG